MSKKDKKVEKVKKDPLGSLSSLIDKYAENRDSYDAKTLTDLRENISLNLFYLADEAATLISDYDRRDYDRKRGYAEWQNYYRSEEGGKNTIAESENLARIDCKDLDDACSDALKEKEKTKIILSATKEILNALSTRLHIIEKK